MSTAVVLGFPPQGHVTPALGLAGELVRRGERVIFYATERSRAGIEACGAVFRAYPRDYNSFDPTPPTDGLFSDMARLIDLTGDMLDELLTAVAGDGPDYVLLDSKSLWGRLVCQILQKPAITMSVVFAVRPGVVPVPYLVNALYGGAPREGMLAGLLSLSRYLETARRIDAKYYTASPGIVAFLGNPQTLNIIFTSREFQLGSDLFGDEYKFVGPSISASRDSDVDFPYDQLDGRPLVYISLGTVFNNSPEFYRACFEAFSDCPWQIVLSCGGSKQKFDSIPGNFIVREYVPQLPILERSAAFVTHGGMGGANEALYYGVPMLVVPQRGDQYLVAGRVSELGIGLSLPPGAIDPEVLRRSTARLMEEPAFRLNAAGMSKATKDAGGPARAAGEILKFISELP